jgi:hypothetical protein
MNELTTEIKKLQSETIDNLKNSKASNTFEHIEQILQILSGFVINII